MAENDKDQQNPPEAQQEAKTVWVRSTEKPQDDGGNKVVLWEKDPAHPKGEIMIAGRKPVEVGMTPAVSQALRDGKIVRVAAPKAEAKLSGK